MFCSPKGRVPPANSDSFLADGELAGSRTAWVGLQIEREPVVADKAADLELPTKHGPRNVVTTRLPKTEASFVVEAIPILGGRPHPVMLGCAQLAGRKYGKPARPPGGGSLFAGSHRPRLRR